MPRVTSVQPLLDQQGQHKTFQGQNGTYYKFYYHLDNGMQGEVMHQSNQPRFPVGSEVEASDSTKNPQYPALKLDKPGGAKGGKGWTPEKEAKVEASGLVQAAIASGAKTDQEIEHLVLLGARNIQTFTARILAKKQAPPAQAQHTSDPQVQYGQPYQPQQNPPPTQPQQQYPQPTGRGGMNPNPVQPLPQQPQHIPDAPGTWDGKEPAF